VPPTAIQSGFTSGTGTATDPSKALSMVRIALVLLVLGLSYMVNAMDRQVFPAVLGSISKEYGLTLSSGGFLSTSFALNIAIFGALSGWFMARFGRRATLLGGIVAFSIFTALTPLAEGYFGLAVYRSLTGAGEALHIGAIFACIGAYFGERRGMAIGVVNAFFGIGAFIGPVVGTLLLAQTGSWRLPFYAFAGMGVIAALLVWAVVPKSFMEAADTEGVSTGEANATPPLSILLSRNLVLAACGFSLIGFTLFAYVSLYATFLRTTAGYTPVEAGAAFGMYGIGALGAFVGGWVSDKLGTKGTLAAVASLAAVGFGLFHGPSAHTSQAALSAAFGFLISGYLYPRFMSILQRNVHPSHLGYAMAIAIPMFYLPGLVAGYLFGRLVELYGWSVASTLTVCLPAGLCFLLMLLYRPSEARGG